jgi:hypothetical protein
MNQVAAQPQASASSLAGRFWFVLRTRFPPAKYVVYCALWVASVQQVARLASGEGSRIEARSYAESVLGAFLLLLFMRIVDEVKDLDVDRVHHPERAFASGRVPLSDVPIFLGVTAASVLLLHFGRPALLAIATAIMAYSLLLLYVDRRWPAFADTMFPNLIAAIQLKVMLIVYAALWVSGAVALQGWPLATLAVAYVTAYLHWEVARKIQWPAAARPDEPLYSSETSVLTSFSIAAALLVLAVFLLWRMLEPLGASPSRWLSLLPLLGLAPACWLLGRSRQRRNRLGVVGLLSYLTFLLVPLSHAVLHD